MYEVVSIVHIALQFSVRFKDMFRVDEASTATLHLGLFILRFLLLQGQAKMK
jgi:hypothetical protein